jgi:ribosome hibernation promoting factor
VQIKIAARHGSQLNDDARERIRQKAEKLLHYFDRITLIEVTVDLERKTGKWVELRVDAEHKHDFVAHDSQDELLVAMDQAVEKIKQQICRYKEKIQNHHRGDGKAAGDDQ